MNKVLKGHSGSIVTLKYSNSHPYIEKVGNVRRNFERMTALSKYNWIVLPQIYLYDEANEILQMEYIHGLDMKTYLRHNKPNALADHLVGITYHLRDIRHDRTSPVPYHKRLMIPVTDSIRWLDKEKHPFNFNFEEFYKRIHPYLYLAPHSEYIGDLTLENIIWTEDRGFIHIDPVTTPYHSVEYDLAKLRQDTVHHWFLRNDPNPDANLVQSLSYINEALPTFEGSRYHDILMLLRIYRHCDPYTSDYNFIARTVNRLWT